MIKIDNLEITNISKAKDGFNYIDFKCYVNGAEIIGKNHGFPKAIVDNENTRVEYLKSTIEDILRRNNKCV